MDNSSSYTPPRVWSGLKESGGRFASINRPTAGPTHDKELPVGRHPLQLYSMGTPNGVKVTVMLEELLAAGHTGAVYDAWLIRIQDGDQFGSGFVSANPNSKIPALVDRSGPAPVRVFESGAILLYLAEKFGAFLPLDGPRRAECLSCAFRHRLVGAGAGRQDLLAVDRVHRRIPVAVKDDGRRAGHGPGAGRRAGQHHAERGLHIGGRPGGQARMHAHGGEQVGVGVAQNGCHRTACRQARHIDALRVDVVAHHHVTRYAGQHRRLAPAAFLVVVLEPVPAARRIGMLRLRWIQQL
jgi:glutathione S-transferase